MKPVSLVMLIGLLMAFSLGTGCSSDEAEPIPYGSVQCTSCKMTVSDTRYGSEVVSATGKLYYFDSPECMFGWSLENDAQASVDVHSMWVTDFAHPATLIASTDALFLYSEHLNSPMSMNVACFSSDADLRTAAARYEGRQVSSEEVMVMAEDYR